MSRSCSWVPRPASRPRRRPRFLAGFAFATAGAVATAVAPGRGFARAGAMGFFRRTCLAMFDGLGKNTRSEEHTSELQSRRDLVCRLLLEKKKSTPATP